MGYHAKLSPSSASRWTDCTASIDAQEGLPNGSSVASRDGTCQHQIGSEVLEQELPDAASYLGRVMAFWVHPESDSNGEDWLDTFQDGSFDPNLEFAEEVTVTQAMVDAVNTYVAYVRELRDTTNATMLVEQRVPIGRITGEESATGQSDAILISGNLVTIVDAKFGRKKVTAYDYLTAETFDLLTLEVLPPKVQMHLQLAMYALGTIEAWGYMYEFTHVKVVIVQPYLAHVSEYSCDMAELVALGEWIKGRAELTRTAPEFKPSAENCHFCKARGNCAAQTQAVIEMACDGFEDLDTATPRRVKDNELGSLYAAIPMMEGWASAIRSRVHKEVAEGRPVMRNDGMFYKLVPGRASARSWKDAEVAEQLLRSFRLTKEQMYDFSLISPTTAEALAKKKRGGPEPVIGRIQWTRLQENIKQTPGTQNPVIALSTDPRPEMPIGETGFEDVPEDNSASGSDDMSDLLS